MQEAQVTGQFPWMPKPKITGCPAGLEYLTQIDQLLITQHIELGEMFLNFEFNNKYSIRNSMGQVIYNAIEDTDCCTRQMCGPHRPFSIHITDYMNQEVMTVRRPYKCSFVHPCFSCSECCLDLLEVESPPGQVIGYVKQLYEGCNVRYEILDSSRETILRIHGPSYCYCYCPGDEYPLQLMSADGQTPIGKISKQWSNLVQELFTNADNFSIQFPMDLDVHAKAVVLGSVFLIDFMYFERQRKRK